MLSKMATNSKMKIVKKKKKRGLSGLNLPLQNRGSESKLHGKKGKTKKKNWIAGAIKHPGALHRQLGVKQGQKIPQSKITAAASKPGTLGRRARLAETLEGMHKKKAKSNLNSGQKAYLKRVGKKGMGGAC